MKQILFSLCFFLIAFSGKADVTIPGEVDKKFKLINIDQFSKYQFTFVIQHYRYFQGYQPTGIEVRAINNNEVYGCSSHGDKSLITATDSSGNEFTSTVYVGGKQNFASNVNGYVEVYKIVSVKNGVIELKLVETITKINQNGKTKEIIKEVGKMGLDNFVTIGLVVSSLFSVLGLVLIFKTNENKTSKFL